MYIYIVKLEKRIDMKKNYILLLFCLSVFYVDGQSISSYVIASAGESTEVNGINISWTLGEIAIETLKDDGETIILTQGFQQGYFEITSIDGPKSFSNNFKLDIYPNPANEYIWINLESDEIKDAIVELYDLEGRLVYNNKFDINEGPNRVNLQELGASQYILRVVDKAGNVLQTFKLIKR